MDISILSSDDHKVVIKRVYAGVSDTFTVKFELD